MIGTFSSCLLYTCETAYYNNSDSDATIEPPGYSSSLDGSQDLFDNTSVSPSFRRKGSTLSSSPGAARYRIKANSSTISKKISKTHEISDSDSDSAEDVRQSKAAVNCRVKKNLTSPHKSSSSTGAGATLSQGSALHLLSCSTKLTGLTHPPNPLSVLSLLTLNTLLPAAVLLLALPNCLA